MSEVTIRNKAFLATLDKFKGEMFSTEGYRNPKYYAYRYTEDLE